MSDVARWPTQIGSVLALIGLGGLPPLMGMRSSGDVMAIFGFVCLLTSLALVWKEPVFYAKVSILLLAAVNAVPFAVQRRWIEGGVGLVIAGTALVATVVFAILAWREKIVVFTKDVVAVGLVVPVFVYAVVYISGTSAP